MADKAAIATHSTAAQAGHFAARIGSKQLVLTHFSGRYQGVDDGILPDDREADEESDSDINAVISEARHAAGSVAVTCAHDGFTFPVPV
jgi:ribonuclease Z